MTAFGWLASFGLIAAAGHVITFDQAHLGKTPPGWTVAMTNQGAPPKWEVVKDPSARYRPFVLAQVSADTRPDRRPLAIFNQLWVGNGDVSVRLKPVSGRENQSGGLVFRYRDDRNYYLLRADALADDVTLYRVENGRCTPISPSGVKHEIQANTWQILKVSMRGKQFQVYVNHHRIFEAQDSTFSGPGKVGLSTLADAVTYFDDFRVYPK